MKSFKDFISMNEELINESSPRDNLIQKISKELLKCDYAKFEEVCNSLNVKEFFKGNVEYGKCEWFEEYLNVPKIIAGLKKIAYNDDPSIIVHKINSLFENNVKSKKKTNVEIGVLCIPNHLADVPFYDRKYRVTVKAKDIDDIVGVNIS